MNKPLSPQDVTQPKVTTGPLTGSRKIYSAPEGHNDLAVPFREVALAEGASFRVYDTSGPYTDPEAAVDVQRGLPPLRKPWIESRCMSSPPPLVGEGRARRDRGGGWATSAGSYPPL
jgi:phosphomethylpyrimidine synthase